MNSPFFSGAILQLPMATSSVQNWATTTAELTNILHFHPNLTRFQISKGTALFPWLFLVYLTGMSSMLAAIHFNVHQCRANVSYRATYIKPFVKGQNLMLHFFCPWYKPVRANVLHNMYDFVLLCNAKRYEVLQINK